MRWIPRWTRVRNTELGTLILNVRQLAGDLSEEQLAPFRAATGPARGPTVPASGGTAIACVRWRTDGCRADVASADVALLTSLPPGKVRFTIVDPVGLGDNFAAFMHLADHDEALVTQPHLDRAGPLEKQLADLTRAHGKRHPAIPAQSIHSIEDYNAQAGEVAEPYRVLVVANFPVNFSPQAARRLVSIVQSGSSCGVYRPHQRGHQAAVAQGLRTRRSGTTVPQSLLGTARPLPLERHRTGSLPADAGRAAGSERVRRTVSRIGRPRSRRTRNACGCRSSSSPRHAEEMVERRQPPRRPRAAGPRRRTQRQCLELGKGTSQHVLVAGKTGSGKSTLLARVHHQSRLAVQPRRGRTVSDRLQERRRIQDLRRPRIAACPRHRHRERARIWLERIAAIGLGAAAARRYVPRRRRQ